MAIQEAPRLDVSEPHLTTSFSPFSGTDPEGDKILRELREKQFEQDVTLTAIEKVIPKGISPLLAIEKAFVRAKNQGRQDLDQNSPHLVIGIQTIIGEEFSDRRGLASPISKVIDRVLFISAAVSTREEAQKIRATNSYNEFTVNKSLLKGPDGTDMSNLTRFYVLDFEKLKKQT